MDMLFDSISFGKSWYQSAAGLRVRRCLHLNKVNNSQIPPVCQEQSIIHFISLVEKSSWLGHFQFAVGANWFHERWQIFILNPSFMINTLWTMNHDCRQSHLMLRIFVPFHWSDGVFSFDNDEGNGLVLNKKRYYTTFTPNFGLVGYGSLSLSISYITFMW